MKARGTALGYLRFQRKRLAAAAGYACLGAFFEAAGFALLIPVVRRMVQGNFDFIQANPWMRRVSEALPVQFGSDFEIFLVLLTLFFFSTLAASAFQFLSLREALAGISRFTNQIRKALHERYLSSGKAFGDEKSAGHLQQVLIGSVSQMAVELRIFSDAFRAMAFWAACVAVLLAISWPLTLLSALIFPPLQAVSGYAVRRLRLQSKQTAGVVEEISREASGVLACSPLIKACSTERQEIGGFSEISDRLERMQNRMDRQQLTVKPVQDTLFLALGLLLLSVVGRFFLNAQLSRAAELVVFFIVLRKSAAHFGFFQSLRAVWASISGTLAALDREFEATERHQIVAGTRVFGGLKSAIHFRELSFVYEDGTQALRNVSFSIPSGRTTAIVGPSGSGKSTIAHLLLRFYNIGPGMIRMDDTDILEYSLESLHGRMAWVGQHTHLFNRSFRHNLTYGVPGTVTEGAVREVLRRARLEECVSRLPSGLDTSIGDQGVRLSGGEKQRLALARAMLKNPEILILDEATSALDGPTEKLVQEAIRETVAGRTALVIAHRLSSIRQADQVVMIAGGQLVESGTMEDLMRKKGHVFGHFEPQ